MAHSLKDKLVIGISSRSLFDLAEENRVYEKDGLEAYVEYQRNHESQPLQPGAAFSLVKNLLTINQLLGEEAVEVVIMSRNSAETSLRIWDAITAHKLSISRAVFAGGAPLADYLKPFSIDLFLSADKEDVQAAIQGKTAAARIETVHSSTQTSENDGTVRIAFDGDCVLFSDEAEQIYESGGLEEFQKEEQEKAHIPLEAGPFASFAKKLSKLQKKIRDLGVSPSPIRTAFVTARNAPAHERVLHTFQDWDLWLDESFFLGGLPKGPVLAAFGAQIFFDDQEVHLTSAENHGILGAQVPRKRKKEQKE